MEEIKYESDDHNLDTSDYLEWPAPAAFCDEAVPVEFNGSPAGNIMLLSAANNSLVEENQSNIRAKISSHPFYPKLLLTCIDCHKVNCFAFFFFISSRPSKIEKFRVQVILKDKWKHC